MTNPKDVNVWNYKPWWCQPWSILLAGSAAMGGSWLIFRTIWFTGIVVIAVLLWWTYFLILYPRLWRELAQNSARLAASARNP